MPFIKLEGYWRRDSEQVGISSTGLFHSKNCMYYKDKVSTSTVREAVSKGKETANCCRDVGIKKVKKEKETKIKKDK